MVDDISWDYDDVARASTILGYSSEATAAYAVGAPSSCGAHEGTLKDKVARIAAVVEKVSVCVRAVGNGLDAASEEYQKTDDVSAADLRAFTKYVEKKGR